MSPPGQSSAHAALKGMGAPKPPSAPRPAPASTGWYAKQQTCPPEPCWVLEHPSDDPGHAPADTQLGVAPGPAPTPPKPPGAPGAAASRWPRGTSGRAFL